MTNHLLMILILIFVVIDTLILLFGLRGRV